MPRHKRPAQWLLKTFYTGSVSDVVRPNSSKCRRTGVDKGILFQQLILNALLSMGGLPSFFRVMAVVSVPFMSLGL